jgi:uncharacterized protein YdiU (UPF0061 family)
MRVGFIHGVMNTDNMSISGETIDYGPCAFMNVYDPKTCFSSIDTAKRYAFASQPGIAQWNLWVFANSLMSLIHESPKVSKEMAVEVIEQFPAQFGTAYYKMMGEKLGVEINTQEGREWVEELLSIMEETHSDYTNSFLLLEGKEVSEVYLTTSLRYDLWLAQKNNFNKIEKENYEIIVVSSDEEDSDKINWLKQLSNDFDIKFFIEDNRKNIRNRSLYYYENVKYMIDY